MKQVVTLSCDASPLTTFSEFFQLGLKSAHTPLGVGDPPLEVVRLEHDMDPARADELTVRLYPSDALLRFAAALFTGNLYLDRIKEASHDVLQN